MAVQGQKREGFSLYTGLCDMEVVAINPTESELKALFNRDEVRLTDYRSKSNSGDDRLRLDIYLRNTELGVNSKLTIWLESKLMQSKDGDLKQYINQVGTTCWMKPGEDGNPTEVPVWFKGDYRQAYLGEEVLYRFLAAWTNIDTKKPGSQIVLDTPFTELVNGDVSELQGLCDADMFGDQKVRVLLSVKDGKYQDVYPKVFLPEGSTYVKKLVSTLEDDKKRGYAYKSDYQSDLTLKRFTGSSQSVEADTEADSQDIDPEEALRRLQEQANN